MPNSSKRTVYGSGVGRAKGWLSRDRKSFRYAGRSKRKYNKGPLTAHEWTLIFVVVVTVIVTGWSHGLLFHQAVADCARAAILLPLGIAVFHCQPVYKCLLVETVFLLLVTVSTVNMLTTVLNDSPIFLENKEEQADLSAPLLMDSPQCALFGTFMIWFASTTINLGPTFLSGVLAASAGSYGPSCPLVRGPFRHYVLNALWIDVNTVCTGLTLFHLRKLRRDLTKANVEAVQVAGLVTTLVCLTGDNRRMDSLLNSVGSRLSSSN